MLCTSSTITQRRDDVRRLLTMFMERHYLIYGGIEPVARRCDQTERHAPSLNITHRLQRPRVRLVTHTPRTDGATFGKGKECGCLALILRDLGIEPCSNSNDDITRHKEDTFKPICAFVSRMPIRSRVQWYLRDFPSWMR